MSGSVLTIPYSQSRPLVIAGRLTAPLAGGAYTWNGDLFASVPVVSLRAEYLYILASLSVAADLDPADYSAAIDTTYSPSPIPSVRILQRLGQSVLPDAVPVPAFFADLGIVYPFAPKEGGNPVQFSALGRLTQTPALVGKPSVSLSVSGILYEVADPVWIQRFMSSAAALPGPSGSSRPSAIVRGERDSITLDAATRAEVFG